MLFGALLASAYLALMIAAVLIAVGIAQLIMGWQLRRWAGWDWPLLLGLISGGMITAQ